MPKALSEDSGKRLDDEESKFASVHKSQKCKGHENDQLPSGPSVAKKPAKKSDNRSVVGNKSSRNAANVEATKLRAKTFFNAVAAKSPVVNVDLCSQSDTDEEPSTNKEPESDHRAVPQTPDTNSTSLQSNPKSHALVTAQINATPQNTIPQKTPTPIANNTGHNSTETGHYHMSISPINKDSTPPPTSIMPPCSSSSPVTSSTRHTLPQTRYNTVTISPISKKSTPQPAARMQSYLNLPCADEDTSTQNVLSGILGGAIRQSYNEGAPQRTGNVELELSDPACCSNCALYKARNEELQAQLTL